MNAVDQIIRCYQHQWPQEYDRDFIPYPTNQEVEPCHSREPIPLNFPEYVSPWCAACGCDHTAPLSEQSEA